MNFPYFKSYLSLDNLMPILTMTTKFGSGAALLTTYSASFGDEQIFPSKKRATAIGICNIIARSITVFAPMINELVAPIPMLFFIASVSFALIISFSISTTTVIYMNVPKDMPIKTVDIKGKNMPDFETCNTSN